MNEDVASKNPTDGAAAETLRDVRNALELSGEKAEARSRAETGYFGASETGTGLARGIVMAAVGYFGGSFLGKIGEKDPLFKGKPNTKHRDIKSKTFGTVAAFGLGMMGLYTGMRDERMRGAQVRELQDTLTRFRDKEEVLKDELRHQVKARLGDEDANPKLDAMRPEWEKKKTQPDTEIDAASTQQTVDQEKAAQPALG